MRSDDFVHQIGEDGDGETGDDRLQIDVRSLHGRD